MTVITVSTVGAIDTVRTSFTPEEVCRLTMEFYRRNYIEGLFLSSGVLETPDHTMELLYQTLYRLRRSIDLTVTSM